MAVPGGEGGAATDATGPSRSGVGSSAFPEGSLDHAGTCPSSPTPGSTSKPGSSSSIRSLPTPAVLEHDGHPSSPGGEGLGLEGVTGAAGIPVRMPSQGIKVGAEGPRARV